MKYLWILDCGKPGTVLDPGEIILILRELIDTWKQINIKFNKVSAVT